MNPVQVHQIGQYPACLSLLPVEGPGEGWPRGGEPYAGGEAGLTAGGEGGPATGQVEGQLCRWPQSHSMEGCRYVASVGEFWCSQETRAGADELMLLLLAGSGDGCGVRGGPKSGNRNPKQDTQVPLSMASCHGLSVRYYILIGFKWSNNHHFLHPVSWASRHLTCTPGRSWLA